MIFTASSNEKMHYNHSLRIRYDRQRQVFSHVPIQYSKSSPYILNQTEYIFLYYFRHAYDQLEVNYIISMIVFNYVCAWGLHILTAIPFNLLKFNKL